MYKALKHQKWAIFWTVIVLVLCNMRMPQSAAGSGFFFEGFDKMTHLGFFFILSVLLFYGKIKYAHTSFRKVTILKILLLNALIGGSIELLQWKVFTYRSAEWWDFACDMLGSMMAVFSYVMLHKLNSNENKN